MKKSTLIIIISLFFNFILCGCLIYKYNKNTHKIINYNQESLNKKIYKIAIIKPTTHPSLEQIQTGFIDTIKKNGQNKYKFTVFNANGSRTLMRAQIEEIIQSEYNLIFTITTQCTKMAKELTTKKQTIIPIVFGAANEPVNINLIKTEKNSENHLTGIKEDAHYQKQLDALCTLKKNIKNMLLVYDASQSTGFEKDIKEITRICHDKNINLKTLEIYQANEVYHKVNSLASGNDVIMVLKDNTVVSAIDGLVKICNQLGITLLATDLDSIDKGAAIAYGVKEYNFGTESAKKALLILDKNYNPSDIPTTSVPNFKIKINSKTATQQGLKIDPNLLDIIKNGIVI